jgi:GTP1/Obg family GTP-binding protein
MLLQEYVRSFRVASPKLQAKPLARQASTCVAQTSNQDPVEDKLEFLSAVTRNLRAITCILSQRGLFLDLVESDKC